MANNIKDDCDCCTNDYCDLGVSKLDKISDKCLIEILKEESRGKKQKVGKNLKAQNDRILRQLFSLGEGLEKNKDGRLTFNNLSLDKLRKENDSTSDLGKKYIISQFDCLNSVFSQTLQHGSWKSYV